MFTAVHAVPPLEYTEPKAFLNYVAFSLRSVTTKPFICALTKLDLPLLAILLQNRDPEK